MHSSSGQLAGEQFRTLLDDIPAMYFAADAEGTVLSVNRFGAEYLGYEVDELIGIPVLDLAAEEDRAEVAEVLAGCIRRPGELCRWEYRKLRKNGERIWVREIARPVMQDDGQLVILIVCDDVTDPRRVQQESQQRREDLERITESRNRLMRGFSHDLKNPLGAADGHAQLLEEGILGELAPRQLDSVRRIRRSIRGALGLIDDLMELARAETGQIELQCVEADLVPVAQEVVEDFRAQGAAEGLELKVDLPESCRLYTDPGRVRQILGNLLSNALKYTSAGEVAVEVLLAADGEGPGEGRWGAIRVRDTGPGIPEDKREQIFLEFTRLDPGAPHGAGVGLAISRRVARLLGGDITVESEPERGSRFTLWLPSR